MFVHAIEDEGNKVGAETNTNDGRIILTIKTEELKKAWKGKVVSPGRYSETEYVRIVFGPSPEIGELPFNQITLGEKVAGHIEKGGPDAPHPADVKDGPVGFYVKRFELSPNLGEGSTLIIGGDIPLWVWGDREALMALKRAAFRGYCMIEEFRDRAFEELSKLPACKGRRLFERFYHKAPHELERDVRLIEAFLNSD